MDNIYLAYRKARKGKSWQDTVKVFEANLEKNIQTIYLSLKNKSFTTSPYTTFTIYEPKPRLVYRLPFNPDRIVQHALMNILEPIWDRMFIYDSYSCRKGKGIHAGSLRTMEFIRKVGKDGYCLKMDVSKFYPSIDHDILFEIIKKKIKCKDTLWLLYDIIYSIKGGKGIPIGNYTSQWLGNLYLHELDLFIKQSWKVKYYIRYCDDAIVLHKEKSFLNELAQAISEFLQRKLKLKLKKSVVFPLKHGIDFLGYRHFPSYKLLRKSTAIRLKRRFRKLPTLFWQGKINSKQFLSSVMSALGWLRHCNCYNLKVHILNEKVLCILKQIYPKEVI